MLSSVLSLGLQSIDQLAAKATRRRATPSTDPLVAYPRLQAMLRDAEKSGSLAAERRRLIRNKLAA